MKDAAPRAKRVIDAHIFAPETAYEVEEAVARELLSIETIQRDAVVRPLTHADHGEQSPMEATSAFGKALEQAMTTHADAVGRKAPKRGKYDPLFSTKALFREVWRARQAVDELGIPYEFYCASAVTCYWLDPRNKRNPRPSRLLGADIREHVMKKWAGLQRAARNMLHGVSAGTPMAAPVMSVTESARTALLPSGD